MDIRGPDNVNASFAEVVTAPAGGSFGPEQQLSPSNLNAAGAVPAVAPDGRTTVVWTQLPILGTTGTTEAASDSGPGTSFGDTQILSEQPQSAAQPAVGVDGSGRFTAAWDQAPTASDLSSQIFVNVLPADGPPWIGRQLVATGAEVLHPHVAAAQDGSSILTFDASDGTNQVHAAVRGPTQSAYGPDQLLAEGEALGGSKIAMDAQGNGFATWYSNFPHEVQVTGFDAAGPVLSDVSVPGRRRRAVAGLLGDGARRLVRRQLGGLGLRRRVVGVGHRGDPHLRGAGGLSGGRAGRRRRRQRDRGAPHGAGDRVGRRHGAGGRERVERFQRGPGVAGAPGHRARAGGRAERHAHLARAHQQGWARSSAVRFGSRWPARRRLRRPARAASRSSRAATPWARAASGWRRDAPIRAAPLRRGASALLSTRSTTSVKAEIALARTGLPALALNQTVRVQGARRRAGPELPRSRGGRPGALGAERSPNSRRSAASRPTATGPGRRGGRAPARPCSAEGGVGPDQQLVDGAAEPERHASTWCRA